MNTEKKQWIAPVASEIEVNGGDVKYQTERSFAGAPNGGTSAPTSS